MRIKRFLIIGLVIVISFLIVAVPVFAIVDPTDIFFGSNPPASFAKVFENVSETGDMLFLAEGFVDYAAPPTDYTASEAFIFEVRSTDGTAVLISRSLESYGDRPISIYLTSTQVGTLGLTSGTAYIMRITGNPLIFPILTEGVNMISYPLGAADWFDQSTATEVFNPLRYACISMAGYMQTEDGVTTYIMTSEGIDYLTPLGASLFLVGVPSLNVFVPSLFQITSEAATAEDPPATGTLAILTTPLIKWGPNVPGGTVSRFHNIGEWFGVSEVMAAGVILMAFIVLLSVWLYKKTQSGKVVLAMGVGATLPVGAFLGMTPLVLMFIIAIFIVLMLGYYFLTRGSL